MMFSTELSSPSSPPQETTKVKTQPAVLLASSNHRPVFIASIIYVLKDDASFANLMPLGPIG